MLNPACGMNAATHKGLPYDVGDMDIINVGQGFIPCRIIGNPQGITLRLSVGGNPSASGGPYVVCGSFIDLHYGKRKSRGKENLPLLA